MIFIKVLCDKLVQTGDMFRIDASKSFKTSPGECNHFNVYPDYTNNPTEVYDVKQDKLLDYAYDTAGTYTVRIEAETSDPVTKVHEFEVEAITPEVDNLFSDDTNINAYESELSKYIPEGRNSWIYLHRKAQEEILDYLYRNAILDRNEDAITKDQITIDSKLTKWATFEAILLIYQDIKTSNSEAFNEKITDYATKRNDARNRYIIEIDSNRDGNIDDDDTPVATRPTFFSR